MLSSIHGDLSLLPRSPVHAATPSWAFNFAPAASSSYQIDRFSQPLAFSEGFFPPSIDSQEGLQQHAAGRPQNEDKEEGNDGFPLGTESSPNRSHLQLRPSERLAHLQFQDVASRNVKSGWSDEDCNTTTRQPLDPPHCDEIGTSGCSKRLKLSELEGPRLETKAEMSPSQMKKLGGRITALQQLVSPFGKTDTASVLLKAIEYIKFLQDQVQVLSTPYMMPTVSQKIAGKPSTQSRAAELGTDLRSRGLCLVPVSCTPEVANSNGADYWASGISRC